ncbi:MAG: magnesium transporter [Chromatiales bacterium]|jgi:magnesium transporter|nr:magnesium transporter [Chromatiales bacterium]
MNVDNGDQRPLGLARLNEALESGTLRRVRSELNSMHPAEIADLLESLPPAQRDVVWELVDLASDGEVLVELNDEVRSKLVDGMEVEELVAATEGMDLDDLADLVPDLPETVTRQVLQSMDHQDRERLRSVLAYPEDSAGGLMEPDVVAVRPDVTLEVVIRYLRMRGELPRDTDVLFVVNRHDRYLGVLYLTTLLTEDPSRNVAEIFDTSIEGISATTDAGEVARLFETRDLVTAPVTAPDGRLVGRITVDDVVDVIRDQADHSIMSMAGLDEDEDMFAPVITSSRRRAIWLGVNLATAFLAAWVVGLFQATIEQVVALAVLMPVVASMGGIAGSQTLTLMIRGLALGQVQNSNARWLMIREVAVGALNGLAWAAVVAAATVLWFDSWMLGGIIALALLINLVVAAVSGVVIPLLMKRMGIDPALAGSVVLTTVTDAVGFLAFLGLGALLLT